MAEFDDLESSMNGPQPSRYNSLKSRPASTIINPRDALQRSNTNPGRPPQQPPASMGMPRPHTSSGPARPPLHMSMPEVPHGPQRPQRPQARPPQQPTFYQQNSPMTGGSPDSTDSSHTTNSSNTSDKPTGGPAYRPYVQHGPIQRPSPSPSYFTQPAQHAPTVAGPQVRPPPPPQKAASRVNSAAKIIMGTAAAGALVYGLHDLAEDRHVSETERKQRLMMVKEEERRRTEAREQEARRQREEEERRRRDEYLRMSSSTIRPMQSSAPAAYPYGSSSTATSYQTTSVISSLPQAATPYPHPQPSSKDTAGFRPPAPFGQRPYTFDPADRRHPDPSRSTEHSSTAETYPELRHNPKDTVLMIGSILALKHTATGRFLHTDRSHSTRSGSNQQMVYAHKRNVVEDDWWQVLPANCDEPNPGAMVVYGNQIRLRHLATGRHLHSAFGYREPLTGQNEVVAYGDQTMSNENDHWVVEKWGEGAYGKKWKSTDPLVLRHYVSGMALSSRDMEAAENIQVVCCQGPGGEESDKWKVVLAS